MKGGVLTNLSSNQKFSLLALVVMVLVLPVGLVYALNPKSFTRSSAQGVTSSRQNFYPQVLTSSLEDGKVGTLYTYPVEAQDGNGDYIEMNFFGLPEGLAKGECHFSEDSAGVSNYTCGIVGTPTVAGVFEISISVTDELIATSVKDLPLTIFP